MHNALARLQTTLSFASTCAFALAGIIAFLSIIPFPPSSSSLGASISATNVQVVKGRPHRYATEREEYAQIRFDLDANLSPLFTWNTKQVFVYVTANYPSNSEGASSEAVIWDTIIPATSTPFSLQTLKSQYWDTKSKKKNSKRSKSKTRRGSNEKTTTTTDLTKPGVISLKNQKPKYQITDPSGGFSERTNATLQVSWNVQPWVGALVWDKGYLGSRVGAWQPGNVGRSEPFDFPPLKGSKPEVVREKSANQTPEAGEASTVADV
jgi:Signal peptidase subunit